MTGMHDSIPSMSCQLVHVGAPGTPEAALGWTTAILSHCPWQREEKEEQEEWEGWK